MYVARLKHVLQGKYEKTQCKNISQIKCNTANTPFECMKVKLKANKKKFLKLSVGKSRFCFPKLTQQ